MVVRQYAVSTTMNLTYVKLKAISVSFHTLKMSEITQLISSKINPTIIRIPKNNDKQQQKIASDTKKINKNRAYYLRNLYLFPWQ